MSSIPISLPTDLHAQPSAAVSSLAELLASPANITHISMSDLFACTDEGGNNSSLVGDLDVLRLDQLDSVISGNKAFKLLGHLQAAAGRGSQRLLSFGGPFSNHLHALAAAGFRFGVQTVGVVRGYEHVALTPTLQDCKDWGMTLVFADKKTYAHRYDEEYRQQLAAEYCAHVVEEGGSGVDGMVGCHTLATQCRGYDEVWLAVGTGTTALGLAAMLPDHCTLVGVNMVADQGERLRHWHAEMPVKHWRLLDGYHGGGFGRCPQLLRQLIAHYDDIGLPLDPVYTAKLIWAFEQETLRRKNEEGAEFLFKKTLLIHSGGLQGRRGFGFSWPL